MKLKSLNYQELIKLKTPKLMKGILYTYLFNKNETLIFHYRNLNFRISQDEK